MKTCTKENCNAPLRCKGLCNKHYHELKIQRRLKPCSCGCGESTGYTFKHGHHTRLFTPEEQSRRGRHNDGTKQRDRGLKDSYRKVGGRHEHRRVAEEKLGRALSSNEIVHHKNGKRRDNRPDNLEVMSRTQHINEHREDLIAGRRRAETL